MDPQAAWDQLLSAYAEGDWDTIEEQATNLIEWLDRGGFPPKVLSCDRLDADGQRALARAGCQFALETVNSQWTVQPSAPEPCEKGA